MNSRISFASLGALVVFGTAATVFFALGSRGAAALAADPTAVPATRAHEERIAEVPSAAEFEQKYQYADRDALDGFRAGLEKEVQRVGMQLMSARMRAGLFTHYQGKQGQANAIDAFARQDARYWHPGSEPRMVNMMVLSKGHASFDAVALVSGDYPEFDALQAELDWLEARIR